MFELPNERPDGLDSPVTAKLMRWMSRANVWMYRATGGAVGGHWRMGAGFVKPVPVCLLTTTGKKSGVARTVPLVFLQDAERVVLVGSQGGLPKHPLWFGNLQANPLVTIQVKSRVGSYRARTATADERAQLWPRLLDLYADFAKYARWTEREIPVVICEPIKVAQ